MSAKKNIELQNILFVKQANDESGVDFQEPFEQ